MTDLQLSTSPTGPSGTASTSAATSSGTRSPLQPKPRPRRTVRRGLRHAVMILASIVMIYPLLWMVVSSLRPNDEIFRNPSLFPISLDFSNYARGWESLAQPFSHYLINSTLLVLGCVIGNLDRKSVV